MTIARHHQRGYVFRKGSGWYVRYREYTLTDLGDKTPIQRCRKLCDATGEYRAKSAAKVLAEEFLKPFNDGTYQPNNATTLHHFVETDYLPFVQRQMRPSTHDGYRKIWNRYLKSRSAIPLREFKTVQCEMMLNDIARKYDVGRTTLSHIKNMLSGVFRYAARIGVLNAPNPVRDACIPPSRPSTATYAYSLEEITEMLALLTEPANVVVAVAAFTGLRRGEIRGLRTEDYGNSALQVRRSIWKSHTGEPKGKRGRGSIPVIAPLAELLGLYLAQFGPKTYLFENANGGPIDLDYLSREKIAPVLQKHGLRWYGWHAFRRGLATNLYDLGVSDLVIQTILRHCNVEVTRESYIKRDAVDGRSLAAMKALEAMVCNQCATGLAHHQKTDVVN